MKSPFTGKEMNVVKEWRILSFRKDEFKILVHMYRCEDTGEQFEDDEFAQLNYNQLVNQYRVKYGIPFPEQIIAIREKYGLSALKMAGILGFGVNSYRNYENGEVPNQSNARLIQISEDPIEFKRLVDLCMSLDQKVKDKVYRMIDRLITEERYNQAQRQLEYYFFGSCMPGIYTGFKTPNFEKFAQMVVFFTEKLHPWKTKLNKLLFYSDFKMYQQTGFSISGVQYEAITMGPVPNNFHGIFEYLVNKDFVDVNYVSFADGGTGEQFVPGPDSSFKEELFTKKELNVLNNVVDKFKNVTTNEIIEISHEEKAWIENINQKGMIDYSYGFDLIH